MSAVQWRDWSCAVRVVVADGRPADAVPEPGTAAGVEHTVRTLMDDVARAVSRFDPTSDLSRVNAARGRLRPVRPLTLDLVEVALDAARRTDGACDPTVGGHVVRAGYDADLAVVLARGARPAPTPATPAAAGWRTVRVDRALGRLGVPPTLALDLGATAKAWTADEAAARVADRLGVPVLVALGGDLAVAGGDHPWPVLVSEHDGGPGQVVTLRRGGLATSSTQSRRWPVAGRRGGLAHHLVDPRTGEPTDGSFRTVSVVAETCVAANTLSTAALVWGDDAPARLAPHPARLVDADGQVVGTAGWPAEDVAA